MDGTRRDVDPITNVYLNGKYVMVKLTVWMGQTRKNVDQRLNQVRKTIFIIIELQSEKATFLTYYCSVN